MKSGNPDDPRNLPRPVRRRLTACIDLIRRTGAESVQIRYSDDEEPVVWFLVAAYTRPGDPKSGNPAKRADQAVHETAAALTPDLAALRLCDQLIDGGECQHCHRTTGVTEDWATTQPLDDVICWYVYDPELKKFRRSCEAGR